MTSFREEITNLIRDSTSDIKVTENLETFRQVLSEENKRKSYKFVRTILFPEYSKGARYPGRFQSPSGIYSLYSEFLVNVSNASSLGLMIRPHAQVNENLLYNFSNATQQNWGIGFNVKPYNTEQESPSIPPEIFFRSHRLIGCSVTLEGISDESSGVLKGGIEYEVSDNFMLTVIGDNRQTACNMLLNAIVLTSAYKFAKEMRKLFIDRYTDRQYSYNRFGSVIISYLSSGNLNAAFTGANYPVITANIINNCIDFTYDERDPAVINSVYQPVLNENPQDPPMTIALKIWRSWYRADLPILYARRLFTGIVAQHQIGDDWPNPTVPRNNFRVVGADLNTFISSVGAVFGNMSEISETSIEFLARYGMRNAGPVSNSVNSESVQSPPLNYNRLQLTMYRQEAYYDSGIRLVYVPQNPDIKYDRFPNDLMFIGGIALPRGAPIRVKIVRHFEGHAFPGIGKLFSISSEPENEEALQQLNMIIKKYPGILKIPPRELKEVYEKCKKSFKWVDLTIKETNSGFALVKDRMESIEIGDLQVPYLEQ